MKKGMVGVRYEWLALSLVLGLISHWSRAVRWNYLIHPLGFKPRTGNTFMAVMIMYAANMALPRLGEVTRCTILERYEKVPFAKSLGTVVVERSIDMIGLLLFTAIVFLGQSGTLLSIIEENPELATKVTNLLNQPGKLLLIVTGLLAVSGVVFVFRKKIMGSFYIRVKELIYNVIDGLKTVFKLKNTWGFLGHTVLIWVLYYLMIYVSFFAFDATAHLTPLIAATVFILASYGMVAPVSGGIGAWHFMVILGLGFFGVEANAAAAFAFVVHSTMNLMLLVVGSSSLAILPFYNARLGKAAR